MYRSNRTYTIQARETDILLKHFLSSRLPYHIHKEKVNRVVFTALGPTGALVGYRSVMTHGSPINVVTVVTLWLNLHSLIKDHNFTGFTFFHGI